MISSKLHLCLEKVKISLDLIQLSAYHLFCYYEDCSVNWGEYDILLCFQPIPESLRWC